MWKITPLPKCWLSFWEIWCGFLLRSHFVIRGFSPWTASGFYPWGNVECPRERVAEWLCGWRHGNSFPMTQSAQSLRQMRSIPHCSKAVFYVFVFDYIHNSATLHNLSPGIFHWTQNKGMTYSFSITGCIRNLISGGAFHAWFKTPACAFSRVVRLVSLACDKLLQPS